MYAAELHRFSAGPVTVPSRWNLQIKDILDGVLLGVSSWRLKANIAEKYPEECPLLGGYHSWRVLDPLNTDRVLDLRWRVAVESLVL